MSDFYKKLVHIQSALNAPKGQFNSFGKYNYRNCEDILVALKPLLSASELFQTIDDEVIQVGERFYIKATVTVTDGKETVKASALAREAATKKGMDDSQLTGATSSYARKYALNGMWSIDDSKDADTNAYRQQETAKAAQKASGFSVDNILGNARLEMSKCDSMDSLKIAYVKHRQIVGRYDGAIAYLDIAKDKFKKEIEGKK